MHRKNFLRYLPATLTALLLSGAALLAGCGGGGGGGGSSSPGPQTTSYAEAVTLADGQSGALTLAASGGSASGTLAVAPAATASARPRTAAPRAAGALPAGVYPVSGTLANGVFTLNGTVSGTPFTLTVTLPSGATAGTFSLATGGSTYPGTLAAAPTGTTANSAIAGTYVTVSLTNPVTGQTATCPGSLSFASGSAVTDTDNCVASEDVTFSSNGSVSGDATGTYRVTGNIVTYQGTETNTNYQVTRGYTYTLSGSTLTLTLFYSSDAPYEGSEAADGEVVTLNKITSATSFPYAGTYALSDTGTGPQGSFSNTSTVVINANGALQYTDNNASNGGGPGTATVNSSGQVVLTVNGNSGSDTGLTITLTGTVTGSAGSYKFSGTATDSAGDTATWTATENGTATANPFAGTYTGVSSSDPSYGYDTAITNFTVTSSGTLTANVNEGNVIGTISGSVNSAGTVTASGGSTQDTYTFTGTFQTVNGVMEATGTYKSSGQTLPGHWVVVQSASTGADSQIAGSYAGTVANSTSSGTAGTIINANGTATLADNSGDVAIGNATVNGNGQVVLTVTNPNNGNVITFTGTLSGTAGSQTLAGNYAATESSAPSGASGKFNFTQFNPNQTQAAGSAKRR